MTTCRLPKGQETTHPRELPEAAADVGMELP
jgi:hypothetical protein